MRRMGEMTRHLQAQQMRLLRLQGLAYCQIGEQLGVSRFVVYNRLHRRTGLPRLEPYLVPHHCAYCGQEFRGRVGARFCSNNHRRYAWLRHRAAR